MHPLCLGDDVRKQFGEMFIAKLRLTNYNHMTTIQNPYAEIVQFYFEIEWAHLKLHGFT